MLTTTTVILKISPPHKYIRHSQVIERLRSFILDAQACDLLDKLLKLDPLRRIDASAALDHNFFWTDPMPSDLSRLLSQHTTSMFEYLTARRGHKHRQMQQPQQVKARSTSKALDTEFHERTYWAQTVLNVSWVSGEPNVETVSVGWLKIFWQYRYGKCLK